MSQGYDACAMTDLLLLLEDGMKPEDLPGLDVLALFVTNLGLAIWMGSAFFGSFMVAPLVNRRLNPSHAREMMSQLAPRQHWLAFVCAALMMIGAGGILWIERLRTPAIAFFAFTGVALSLELFLGFVLSPRAASLRERMQTSAGTEWNLGMRDSYDHAVRWCGFVSALILLLLVGTCAALAAVLAWGNGSL